MNPEHFATLWCPYCGEANEVLVEPAAGTQSYVEDCQVCCRPIEIRLMPDGEAWVLEARRDDD
jgi:hypothetical protein